MILPMVHSGQSTNPLLGEFVPNSMYFLSLSDHERYPLSSMYCLTSLRSALAVAFVAFTRFLSSGILRIILTALKIFYHVLSLKFIRCIS